MGHVDLRAVAMLVRPSLTTMTSTTFSVHNSFDQSLIDRYNGFILDQFGVLHNGAHALEGAVELVAALAAAGKKLIILSNSSSLSIKAVEKLPKLGFDPSLLVGAVTSGEEAKNHIQAHHQGEKCLYITWKQPNPNPIEFLGACGDVAATSDVQQADFILLHGCEVIRGADGSEQGIGDFMGTGSLSALDPVLQECHKRNLPLICCNPDYTMVRPDGTKAHMPGVIADAYRDLGGKVAYFGKPYREHFEACVEQLGLPKEKIVHVGDSLHHDICGANATGISSVFVVGGVHREELDTPLGQIPTESALGDLFATHGETPTHVVPMFKQ